MSCFDRRVHEIGRALLCHYGLREPRKGQRILRAAVAGLLADRQSRQGPTAPPPTTLIARLTHRCNLRCVQCGQWGERGVWKRQAPPAASDELSSREWIRLIEAHPRAPAHVYFWGGEPLLRNDLWDLVAAATARGITTELSSNGTLLSPQHEHAVSAGLDYLVVSLDGPSDINDRIRLGSGNGYSAVVEGIRALVELKRRLGRPLPLVEICMTLTEENQGALRAMYLVAKDLGVEVFHVQFGIFATASAIASSARRFSRAFGRPARFFAGFEREVSGMRPGLIREQLAWIEEDVRIQGKLLFRKTPAFSCDPHDYFFRPDRFLQPAWCAVPWKYLQVMPDGDVAFCMDFADCIVGNVRAHDWPAIWNGERARAFRQELIVGGPFAACSRCCTLLASASKLDLVLGHLMHW
jgi:MoaA/NifB/PqqE/SkfB family radical SAM enzyme